MRLSFLYSCRAITFKVDYANCDLRVASYPSRKIAFELEAIALIRPWSHLLGLSESNAVDIPSVSLCAPRGRASVVAMNE